MIFMPIQWVNAMDIKRIHDQRNPNNHIGYNKAREIKKRCIERYEEEFGKVELYDNKHIPLEWYERYYGSGLSTKKGTSKATN